MTPEDYGVKREKYVQPKVKYGDASQMIWGCFVDDKIGPIAFIDVSITKEVYINILSNTLLSVGRNSRKGYIMLCYTCI